ncbi:serine/threonine-protein kinase [Microbispora sp. H10670]|uniref:serine/threonine-protein kinase n=1 Tax=Microbispora sp. H10670 TaxID=2729108 RepID=UPI0015FF71E7|nr:serine/threonine-protein kinase [Microbispora sp. H10670]
MGAAGRLIVKRYRLVRALGRGRTGVVWEGHDTLLDRPVAVREVLLPPGLGETARLRLVHKIAREARQAEGLRHPHIAAVHDVAEEDGAPYIVMELVRSRSLDGMVAGDGPLTPAQAAPIARKVLSALAHAHAAGVRHGDVRPANVLVGHDGRVLLADFGVSMFTTDPAFARTRRDPAALPTASLPTAATAGRDPEDFLAPERSADDPRTIAADLWSLGATLHLAVTGRPPSHPLGEVPEELRTVLTGLLARDPRRRIDAETADRLLAEAEPPAPAPPVRRSLGRARLVAGVTAAVLVACAVGGWAVLRPGAEGRAAAPPAAPVTTPAAPATVPASATGPDAVPVSGSASAAPAPRLKLKWYRSDAGWRAGVPRDWTREDQPYTIAWRAPDDAAALVVEVTAQSGTDPLAALGEAEAIFLPTAKSYRKLRLKPVTSPYGPTADWEFTWKPRKAPAGDHLVKGVGYHQYRRVISTGTTTSVLTWTTRATDWDALRPTLVKVLSLFQPPAAS